jgi:hypothetical protein
VCVSVCVHMWVYPWGGVVWVQEREMGQNINVILFYVYAPVIYLIIFILIWYTVTHFSKNDAQKTGDFVWIFFIHSVRVIDIWKWKSFVMAFIYVSQHCTLWYFYFEVETKDLVESKIVYIIVIHVVASAQGYHFIPVGTWRFIIVPAIVPYFDCDHYLFL